MRAMEIANAANFWVTAHPDDAFTAELKRDLPRILKAQTVAAIDNHQPLFARMFHQAYRQVRFSPLDPELAQRVRQATK
jgi:hypothetical protein